MNSGTVYQGYAATRTEAMGGAAETVMSVPQSSQAGRVPQSDTAPLPIRLYRN